MDERKGFVRPFLKYFVLGSLALLVVLSVYGTYVYWKTQTIENPKQCFVTKMYKVNLCPSNSNYVRYKQVPKHFFQALILSEDASFYSHKGFDWFEIKESFRRNFVEWRFARGGSTLTQQLAKNLYLSKSKSLDRKFKEFFIARQIEQKLSKAQILEKYVNVVEFGKNLYGLKPAARHYFGKSVEALNVLESIFLVSLLPSPKRLGKSHTKKELSKNNLWRMKIIMKRMYRTGKISDEVFVYLKMLLEDTAWPFDHYSQEMFNPSTIEDQMFEEFEQLEDADIDFDQPETESEKDLTEPPSEEAAEPTVEETAEEINEEAGEEIAPEQETIETEPTSDESDNDNNEETSLDDL